MASKGGNLESEVIDVDMLHNTLNLTEIQFVDWLLDSDIHLVLSHMHQGFDSLCWDMEVLSEQYKRFQFHEGFPNGSVSPG